MRWWPWARREQEEPDTSEAEKALAEVLENRPRVERVAGFLHGEFHRNNFSPRLYKMFKGE